LAVTVALAVCLLFGRLGSADDLPVVAKNLVTGPSSHVELTNVGTLPVIAWSLAIVTANPNGGSRRTVETVDAYLSEVTRGMPGMSPKLEPLDPLPADASVEIAAVVFGDTTSAGDMQIVSSIFARRASERDELGKVVDTFDAVLQAKRGRPALEELQARFGQGAGPGESTPHRAAREAVESYMRRLTAENSDAIDQLLHAYVDVVKRQHELAVRHARPNKSSG
jgi:hypothetical protein